MATDINRISNYFFGNDYQKVLFSIINITSWVILQKR